MGSALRISGAALLAALALGIGSPPGAAAFTPEQEADLQVVVEEWANEIGYPGLAVGLWQPGGGRFVTTVGVRNLQTDRPLRTDDRFRIGSITKTLTATLVLQLVERGRLHLQDPVSDYLRGVPFGNRITLRMLLNHTSGIYDLPAWVAGEVFTDPHHNWHPGRIIRSDLRQPRYCPPGECWQYSNTNYLLLGKVIERVTGKRPARLYEPRIFDRMGMPDTQFRPRRPVPAPAAQGNLGGAGDTTEWNFSWIWTAGGAVSTLRDLHRWGPALAMGRGVLSERVQRKRLRSVSAAALGEPGLRYGLGIFELDGFLGHDGSVPGYDSLVLYSPRLKMTIVALGNTNAADPVFRPPSNPDGLFFGLAPRLVDVVEGGPR